MARTPAAAPSAPRPWWRFGYVWLIIGSFAAAVAASGVTVWLAMQSPEASAPAADSGATDGALEPAMQARNRTSSRNARALGLDDK